MTGEWQENTTTIRAAIVSAWFSNSTESANATASNSYNAHNMNNLLLKYKEV